MQSRFEDPLRILNQCFGYQEFRPGQQAVVEDLLSGHNVLAVMPTGSGKSLCYQVPALALPGMALVVSPLVALMQDQVQALQARGIAADTINSARERNDNVSAWRRAASGELKLLYLSPERLMTERMIEAMRRLPISLIAVDEAHCVSSWGNSFRPEYERLRELRQHFAGIPIGAFTATADVVTRKDVATVLFADQVRAHVHGFDRPNIRLNVAPRREGLGQVIDVVRAHKGQSGIVYCLSRKRTEQVAKALTDKGFSAFAYHAGMERAEREASQARFMTAPGTVMVATIAFGMGIDKADVRYVVHVDLPGSLEAYYQEIGRAGRDGTAASAHMFYGSPDLRMRRLFIESEHGTDTQLARRERQRLEALVSYCETGTCRRTALLAYFGETTSACGNCDVCLDPPGESPNMAMVPMILQAVRETGERFGASHLTDVLKGSQTQRVAQLGHKALDSFAGLRRYEKADIQDKIRRMTAEGLLQRDLEFGGLRLGAGAVEARSVAVTSVETRSVGKAKARRAPVWG